MDIYISMLSLPIFVPVDICDLMMQFVSMQNIMNYKNYAMHNYDTVMADLKGCLS